MKSRNKLVFDRRLRYRNSYDYNITTGVRFFIASQLLVANNPVETARQEVNEQVRDFLKNGIEA